MKYSHADTTQVSLPFVVRDYGRLYGIKLGPDSDNIRMHFPIRSRNIRAELTVPDNAKAVFPSEGSLFSLDNIVSSDGGSYTFTTRYAEVHHLGGVTPVRKTYSPEETCLRWEKKLVGDSAVLFQRYGELLLQVIGKERIDSLSDIRSVLEYSDTRINEWRAGPGKTAKQIIDGLDHTGSYEGNCTERETLKRWLLCVGGVSNRLMEGQRACEGGILGKFEWPEVSIGLHAWNEFKVSEDDKEFWVPLDDGTDFPYLRGDSLMTYYLPTQLPRVIPKGDGPAGMFDCAIILDQI